MARFELWEKVRKRRGVVERVGGSRGRVVSVPGDLVEFADYCKFPSQHNPRELASELNSVQRRFLTETRLFKRGEAGNWQPAREVVAKARQMRVTSAGIIGTLHVLVQEPTNAILVLHKREGNIIAGMRDRVRTVIENWPINWPKLESPKTAETIELSNGSRYTIVPSGMSIAQAESVGRSLTYHIVHLSEAGSYRFPTETWTALVASQPADKAMVLAEDTFKNPESWFYQNYLPARKGDWQNTVFDRAHFYPWFKNEVKRLDKNSQQFKQVMDREFSKTLATEVLEAEAKLRAEHGLDDEQVAFRRYHFFCGSAKDRREALKENPESDVEWISDDEVLYFDESVLAQVRAMVRKPIKEVRLTKNLKFRIWRYPEAGRFVMVGADTNANGPRGHDYDFVVFVDGESGDLLAELRGRAWGEELARAIKDAMSRLGLGWESCLVAVERNRDKGVTGFLREMGGVRQVGKAGKDGIYTASRKQREEYLDALSERLYGDNGEPTVDLPSEWLAQELESFIAVDDKGRPGARKGGFDDAIIALAIAYYFLRKPGIGPLETKRPMQRIEHRVGARRRPARGRRRLNW